MKDDDRDRRDDDRENGTNGDDRKGSDEAMDPQYPHPLTLRSIDGLAAASPR